MWLRFYTILLVPVAITVALYLALDTVKLDIQLPLQIFGVEDKGLLKASGPIAIYFALLLISPKLLPLIPPDKNKKWRKRLIGYWRMTAHRPGKSDVKGTAIFSVNDFTQKLMVKGDWNDNSGNPVPWIGQQVLLTDERLSFVTQTSLATGNAQDQKIRSYVDINMAESRHLSGDWYLIERAGSGTIDLDR